VSATIDKHFSKMGARVRIGDAGTRLNVLSDKQGEYFVVPADAELLDVQPRDRHLLLLVRGQGRDKSKFLCGHDERHWFVAAIPEREGGVTSVIKAKEALQPPSVREASKGLRKKDRLKRHTEAYRRQGEWFLLPLPDFEVPDDWRNPIHHNEPIARDARSKPHIAEELFRSGGETVYVGGGRTLSAEQWGRLDEKERRSSSWRAMTSGATVYVRGAFRHPDHATIHLDYWHRVEMNQEQMARASTSHMVAFLD
jgi:hypothetical protein